MHWTSDGILGADREARWALMVSMHRWKWFICGHLTYFDTRSSSVFIRCKDAQQLHGTRVTIRYIRNYWQWGCISVDRSYSWLSGNSVNSPIEDCISLEMKWWEIDFLYTVYPVATCHVSYRAQLQSWQKCALHGYLGCTVSNTTQVDWRVFFAKPQMNWIYSKQFEGRMLLFDKFYCL
jgi:hypothetical protein